MTEHDYQILESLVNSKKVVRTEKHIGSVLNMYTFVMKPAKDKNVSNKYTFNVSKTDKELIEKIDTLILKQKALTKAKNINAIKFGTALTISALIAINGFTIINKKNKYRESIMQEVNQQIEEIKNEMPPNMDVSYSMRKNLYNKIDQERQQNLKLVNDAIEQAKGNNKDKVQLLKAEKEKLLKSYYETDNENAKYK